ncbi:hypothetical protein L3V79_01490 [Thiotrichales bacterium 19S9-12]|nr:hypothetical protein [Thiotrichales bacterium 19S9-11]MCF6811028.1 hypothetical protein [Thiotrichales bacterium 19S9-12]
MTNATYRIEESYQWNYENGPIFEGELPKRYHIKPINIWDFEINSPIGIPAGPLLNANFVALYARLGFDLPVYKTVRTVERQAHQAPNCCYLKDSHLLSEADILTSTITQKNQPQNISEISITNSFGIPSKSVESWQADIELANYSIDKNQLLIVSCVGTPNLEERNIIEDYTLCSQLAVEAGAKAIELNLSCPNVISKEGSIYQDPLLSSKITQAVKQAIGPVPLMIKIGYFDSERKLDDVIKANASFIDGISAINTIPMLVKDEFGNQALPGEGRLKSGVCGHVIHKLSVDMVKKIAKLKQINRYDFIICGCGGVMKQEEFNHFLDAGADIAMSATGAMWDPYLAHKWHLAQTDKFNQNNLKPELID